MISYNSEAIQEICYRHAEAVRHLGDEAATSLKARQADIQAARNVFELLVGDLAVDGNTCTLRIPGLLAIEMEPNYPNHNEGGLYDWATVSRVKLMKINDVK